MLPSLVSVIIATYNRPKYVLKALDSIFRQTYSNYEIILVRDGGAPIDVYGTPPPIFFIDRDENKGLAYSYNEALERAKGEYICYIGDDDIYYPNHIETLVAELEKDKTIGAAYSDLYKTDFWGKERKVVSKRIEVSRDFDRDVMLNFNHVLGGSLMHRRDLLQKTGPYNEAIEVLIDWDITRKLCFFTDFKHVPVITGEYYGEVGDVGDRLSVCKRRDQKAFLFNLLTIRNTRPSKPWSKLKDLAIIVLADKVNLALDQLLINIWSHTYCPYLVYLPMPESDLNKIDTINTNVIAVPTSKTIPIISERARLEKVFGVSDADYFAIIDANHYIAPDAVAWVERGLVSAMKHPEKMYRVGKTGKVMSREYMARYLNIDITEDDLDIGIYDPPREEWPLGCDDILNAIERMKHSRMPDWVRVASLYKYLREKYRNDLWLARALADALCNAGHYFASYVLACEINKENESVETLKIQARAERVLGIKTDTFTRVAGMLA